MKPTLLKILQYGLIGSIAWILIISGWRAYQKTEIVIEWSTASELNTVGYNVYRSLAEDQPGEKINSALIPVGVDTLSENAYSFTDQNVMAGTYYYYWLEDIDWQGNTRRDGPIEITAEHDKVGLLVFILGILLFAGLILGMLWQKRKVDVSIDDDSRVGSP